MLILWIRRRGPGTQGQTPSDHDAVKAMSRSVAKAPQEEASHEFRRRVGRLRACQSDLRAHMKRIVARSDPKHTVAVHGKEDRPYREERR